MMTANIQTKKFSSGKFGQFQLQQENNIMAFVNEAIPEQDKQKVNALINYQTISAIDRWVHQFGEPRLWTVDRERDVYLIDLGGGGGPDDTGRMPYAALAVGDQVVLFNVVGHAQGCGEKGLKWHKVIYNLYIPQSLEFRRDEIKHLIRSALEERAYFLPTINGGTIANPNTVDRENIISFNVEFK
jgi:hypothetical protein